MERKLVTLRRISAINPIEGADRIEKASIDGWTVVVNKGDFFVGDFCIYFEVDSLLPIVPVFSFLAKNGVKKLEDGTEGYRLKTIKLKNVISQGLALPISSFFTIVEKEDRQFIELPNSFVDYQTTEGEGKSVDLQNS